jgi:hypothetical protein
MEIKEVHQALQFITLMGTYVALKQNECYYLEAFHSVHFS